MNVEIVTEAAQFSEKEFINGIFVAVWHETGSFSLFLSRNCHRLTMQLSFSCLLRIPLFLFFSFFSRFFLAAK
jgi:hypothetical protein